jgi:hypothetical protein
MNRYLTDETRLDRLVPYLVTLLSDEESVVRSMALRVLTQTVSYFLSAHGFRALPLTDSQCLQLLLVETLTPSNLDLLPSYILPNTLPFSTDPETLPRVTYALCISRIAGVAKKFLDMAEAMKGDGGFEFGLGGTGNGVGDGEFEGNPYAVCLFSSLHRFLAFAGSKLTKLDLSVRQITILDLQNFTRRFLRTLVHSSPIQLLQSVELYFTQFLHYVNSSVEQKRTIKFWLI